MTGNIIFNALITLLCFVFVYVSGKPVWGESGELVCLKPIPCQPTHFWNDENGSKYHKAYFSTFPGSLHLIPYMHSALFIKALKGIVHEKIKILSSFTDYFDTPNLCDFLLSPEP